MLSSKFQILAFSDNASISDAEKLTSTIASEPYIMDVLDISTHWWISWRDQAFALHEVFLESEYLPNYTSVGNTLDSNVSGGSKKKPIPISLQDFVRAKLAQKDNAIAVATALLGIAMSLQVLRPGVDDAKLHLTCPPSELTDRIVLAVDTVILSPNANPVYMTDPSILLLLMARCKDVRRRESSAQVVVDITNCDQPLQRTWVLPIQKSDCGPSQTFCGVPNAAEGNPSAPAMVKLGDDVTQLVVRQRFLGLNSGARSSNEYGLRISLLQG